MSGGAFLFLSRACAARTKHVGRRVWSPLTNAHREALLKVLSLLRAASPELLCRSRRLTATV